MPLNMPKISLERADRWQSRESPSRWSSSTRSYKRQRASVNQLNTKRSRSYLSMPTLYLAAKWLPLKMGTQLKRVFFRGKSCSHIAGCSLHPGAKEIEGKLNAAEDRRKAHEDAVKGKVGAHLAQVEQRKGSQYVPPPPLIYTQSHRYLFQRSNISAKQIEQKLTAAEQRRKDQETDLHSKLHAREIHAQEVRKRKSEHVADL